MGKKDLTQRPIEYKFSAMKPLNNHTIVDRLIEHFGNLSSTGRALGLDRQLIQQWRKNGRIPFRKAVMVEEFTGGAITKQEVWEAAAK